MNNIKTGQLLLILCCIVYLIWWYRGYRPGITADRVGGMNGILLFITMAFGIAGVVFSLMQIPAVSEPKIRPILIVVVGIAAYVVLLIVTRFLFHRIVTTELFLIAAWTMLEMTVINRLNAGGFLAVGGFTILCIVIAVTYLLRASVIASANEV